MEIRVLKLGTVCLDKATQLKGTLTHCVLGMGPGIRYIFQPKGLDEEGQPVKRLIFEGERLEVSEEDFETIEVPFDILGSQVTDKASGFTGMAVKFIRHVNGCFHVAIQPKGVSPKTRMAIDENDFDLRGCIGEKIPSLTPSERKDSEEKRPSPAHTVRENLPASLRGTR